MAFLPGAGIIEQMDGDEIRELLAKLAPERPTGPVAIPCNSVTDAGADLEEVGRWVRDHGGEKYTKEVHRPKQLEAGRLMARDHLTSTYFEIEVDELRP